MTTLFEQAASLHNRGELDQAEILYSQILKDNPKHAASHCNLGIIKKAKGLDEDAILLLEKAISINADLPAAILNLALLYFSKNDWLESMKKFSSYLKYDPANPWALINLGQCLANIGRHDEAITYYYKSLEVEQNTISYLILTECLLKTGKAEEFSKAIEIGKSIKENQIEDNVDSLCVNDSKLSFNFVNRRIKHLEITKERHYTEEIKAEKGEEDKIDEIYPLPFNDQLCKIDKSTELLSKGYKIKNNLISKESCSSILNLINKTNFSIVLNQEILETAHSEGVIRTVLESINQETGTKNIIWNFLGIRNFSTKYKLDLEIMSADERAGKSELWHIDHNYNKWSQKCLVYLQPEPESESSADFCDFEYSQRFCRLTGYRGWGINKKYSEFVCQYSTELDLNEHTLDPPYIQMKADHPGQALLYCPGRILHRVPVPRTRNRTYLSFSFTPLPPTCNVTIDACVKKSMEILRRKCNPNFTNVDDMPVWI